MKNTIQHLRQYIASRILFSKNYPYPDDASFLEEGIIDSTNILEIIMFIEENYDISVEDDEILPDNFDSIDKIAAFVTAKVTSTS